jgi:hypothetical protein
VAEADTSRITSQPAENGCDHQEGNQQRDNNHNRDEFTGHYIPSILVMIFVTIITTKTNVINQPKASVISLPSHRS